MSTSLGDLLTALDHETRAQQPSSGDSANALVHISTALDYICQHIRGHKFSEIVAEDVARIARDIASSWPHEPGRCTQLAGVVADAIALHAPGMNAADAALTSLSLVTTTRRLVLAIDAHSWSGSPSLNLLVGACDDYRRHAAQHPIATRRTNWLHRPFALSTVPDQLDPAERCQEAVAGIVDYLNMNGRTRLSSRQMLAVARVCEVISTRLDHLSGTGRDLHAHGWRRLRQHLALLTDGHTDPGYGNNGRIMLSAALAHAAIEQVTQTDLETPAITNIRASLPMLATALRRKLTNSRQWLIGIRGDRPLHAGRLHEHHIGHSFKLDRTDLRTTFGMLDYLAGGTSRSAIPSATATRQL